MSGLLITVGDKIIAWLQSSKLVKDIVPSENKGKSIMHLYVGPPIEIDGTPEELRAMLKEAEEED